MSDVARPHQSHFFAQLDTALDAVDSVDESAQPASLWHDAWQTLRTRPIFWASAVLILLVVVVAVFPRLFTSVNPTFC